MPKVDKKQAAKARKKKQKIDRQLNSFSRLDLTMVLAQAMRFQGVTHDELEKRLRLHEGYAQELLGGRGDISIREIADACTVLDCKFSLSLTKAVTSPPAPQETHENPPL